MYFKVIASEVAHESADIIEIGGDILLAVSDMVPQ